MEWYYHESSLGILCSKCNVDNKAKETVTIEKFQIIFRLMFLFLGMTSYLNKQCHQRTCFYRWVIKHRQPLAVKIWWYVCLTCFLLKFLTLSGKQCYARTQNVTILSISALCFAYYPHRHLGIEEKQIIYTFFLTYWDNISSFHWYLSSVQHMHMTCLLGMYIYIYTSVF